MQVIQSTDTLLVSAGINVTVTEYYSYENLIYTHQTANSEAFMLSSIIGLVSAVVCFSTLNSQAINMVAAQSITYAALSGLAISQYAYVQIYQNHELWPWNLDGHL